MGVQASDYAGHCLFLVIVVFLLTFLILTFYNPKWVQRKDCGCPTGENDPMVTVLWALGITLAILLILAMLFYAFSSYC